MVVTELGTVEIQLPFKSLFGYTDRKVGFRFNILSWSIMCQLFEPEIEFHQIDEIKKTSGAEVFEKMVLAGALAYDFKYPKVNPKVTIENVKYWLNDLPATKRDKIVSELQVTILNSKMMGKTMSSILTDSKGTEKKKK